LLGIHRFRIGTVILTSSSDLHLKIIDLALDLRLCELLQLLNDYEEILSHLRTVSQSILVAGIIVLKELLKYLLRIFHL
jgi:hypothetical protein